jgi:dienelactone hydrolase
MEREYFPHPIPMMKDPREMFSEYIANYAMDQLEKANEQWENVLEEGNADDYIEKIRRKIITSYGFMPFRQTGNPLKTTMVSKFGLPDCTIENVLFDSFPGWRVNATIYTPLGKGPFPAVVIPVGHSGKQFANYQIPARAFASLGYIAVTFDPPGQASEKQVGNDHFHDGVRCYAAGAAFNRFFVLDALRCIDYLETRNDVYLENGVGMTGVSGGGVTTLYASIFDSRIACQGPSCCLTYAGDHPVGTRYSGCPETMWYGRFADGIDGPQIAAASLPVPLLYMAGSRDEIFSSEKTLRLVKGIRDLFEAAGYTDRFDFFHDSSGHAYTLNQVSMFTSWMERWIFNRETSPVNLELADFPLLEREMLRCYPPERENTFTLTRKQSKEEPRRGNPLHSLKKIIPDRGPGEWKVTRPFQMWTQNYYEGLHSIHVPSTIGNILPLESPCSVLNPLEKYGKQKWVILVSDKGRRYLLESGGLAMRISGLLNRESSAPHPNMVIPDLPGIGDTEGALLPFSAAPWGSIDRYRSYVSNASGEGVIPLQTMCLVSLLRKLKEEYSLSWKDIILYGQGTMGVAVLFSAAMITEVRDVVLDETLVSFQELLNTDDYAWPASMFVPEALKYFDIPDLIKSMKDMGMKIDVINSKDGKNKLVEKEIKDPEEVLKHILNATV